MCPQEALCRPEPPGYNRGSDSIKGKVGVGAAAVREVLGASPGSPQPCVADQLAREPLFDFKDRVHACGRDMQPDSSGRSEVSTGCRRWRCRSVGCGDRLRQPRRPARRGNAGTGSGRTASKRGGESRPNRFDCCAEESARLRRFVSIEKGCARFGDGRRPRKTMVCPTSHAPGCPTHRACLFSKHPGN